MIFAVLAGIVMVSPLLIAISYVVAKKEGFVGVMKVCGAILAAVTWIGLTLYLPTFIR